MRAVVHRIDHALDTPGLADYALLWLHYGSALAALGEAMTIDVPAGARATAAKLTDNALSSIDCEGDVAGYGPGPCGCRPPAPSRVGRRQWVQCATSCAPGTPARP